MTRIVLLGAGASFGSEDVSPSVPPLGDKLFDALVSRKGVAASLPEELNAKFRKNFEVGMAAFYEYSNGDVMRFQRELAHYMAEFEPGSGNAYIRLVRELDIERCILCTLNYDMLIELSALHLGIKPDYKVTPTPRSLRLLKLHGSCNFWPDMPGFTIINSTFRGGGRGDIGAPVWPLTREETIRKCNTEDSLAPAIAMYAEGKPVRVCPDYVQKQQRMWAQAVATATKICIAGARIHPPDTHIWEPISATKADVFYFGLRSDRKSFDEWKETSGKKNACFIESDFSAALPELSRIVT